MTSTQFKRFIAVAALTGGTLAFAAPAANAVSLNPQSCPAGSHGVVVSNPSDKDNPYFFCVSVD